MGTQAVVASSIEDHSSGLNQSTVAGKGFSGFPASYFAIAIAVLVVAGSYSLLPFWLFMGHLWLQDSLRTIGAAFPLIAFAGVIAAWRRIGWARNGSLWGLPLIAFGILLARAATSITMDFRIHQQNQSVLHPGMVIFLYGVGAVLLFGGTRLLRVSIAPLCLLLLVNPVPYAYNAAVDLPLQFLSANTARHFAHLIGLQPTGEQLRMMFTPNFGMMIVPGCNGVRGSVTLGYLALIFGYMRHLRPRALALTALGAFLMGYVLNLVRLCTLVIYYRIGITHTSIQPYGAGVDYAIGCTLFLFATLGVGLFIRWIEPPADPGKADESVASVNSARVASKLRYAAAARVICFAILTLAFIVPSLVRGDSVRLALPSEQALMASLPSQVGSYRLTRTYPEYAPNGTVEFAMGDYSTPPDSSGATSQLTFGVFVGSGMHLVATSRFTQGIRPNWIGSFDSVDAETQPMHVHYVTTLYDDGTSREYDAESACYETKCFASIETQPNRLFISAPTISDLTSTSNGKRLPILLRRAWPDTDSTPTEVLRSKFEADAQQFTQHLNLRVLLRADGTPI